MRIDTFKVEEWMNEYEKYSKYDLGNTTVQTLSLDELFQITSEDKTNFLNMLCSQKLGYGCIKGMPALKHGISKLYKTIKEDDILPTIGAAGANHLVFYSLVEPCGRVISVIPTYQQLYSIPASFGADVQYLHLRKGNNFLPDIDELKSLITPNTKLLCLNNPNNPTGALIPTNLLEEIIKIARSIGAYILCDEVYRGLNISDTQTPSVADLYEKGISVCSMSKVFSLAGLRLGWAASRDKKVMNACLQHREYNMISCSMPDEILAALALKHSGTIIKRNQKVIRECALILDEWINKEEHFSCVKPQAGTTALIYYDFQVSSKEFCDRLAKEQGVFLTPGFCFEQENCFRVGYCKSPDVLRKGLEAISRFAANNLQPKLL